MKATKYLLSGKRICGVATSKGREQMPNWVYNNLILEGNKELIDEVVEQLAKPYTKGEVKYSNPIISFWNIVKPSDEILDEYNGVCDSDGMKNTNNWYNWNNANWGTKWDIGSADGEEYPETSMNRADDTSVAYNFQTAWSPPVPAIEALSVKYPDLWINLSYQEEQGWGGEICINNGTTTITSEYNWKCECGYEEANSPDDIYCEECEEIVCPECNLTAFNGDTCEHQEVEPQDDWI